jgi:hypothetical protein
VSELTGERQPNAQLFSRLSESKKNPDSRARREPHTEEQAVEQEIDAHGRDQTQLDLAAAVDASLLGTSLRNTFVVAKAIQDIVDQEHRRYAERKTENDVSYECSSLNLG